MSPSGFGKQAGAETVGVVGLFFRPRPVEGVEPLLDDAEQDVHRRIAADWRTRIFQLAEALFQTVAHARGIPRHYLDELLAGMEMDVANVAYESWDTLVRRLSGARPKYIEHFSKDGWASIVATREGSQRGADRLYRRLFDNNPASSNSTLR